MKLIPVMAVLVSLAGVTSCGDDSETTGGAEQAATSVPDETSANPESEAPPTTADAIEETEEPDEPTVTELTGPTNPAVIAYCDVVNAMVTLEAKGKPFGEETAKLDDLTIRMSEASADELTDADNDAIGECSGQLNELYGRS